MPETRQELIAKLNNARQEYVESQARLAELEALLREDQSGAADQLMINSYEYALGNLLEGCQLIAFDWRYLYINEAAAHHARQTRGELLGHTMMERYPGIEQTEMFTVLQRCMTERTAERITNKFIYPDGSIAWFELRIQPATEGIFVLSLDITDRQQADEALHRYAQRLEILHEIDLGLIHGTSVQTLVDVTLKHVRQLIPCQRSILNLVDETTGQWIVYAADLDSETALGPGVRVPITPDIFEGYDARHIRVFDDLRRYQDQNAPAKQLVNEGFLSGLNVLLMERERPIGSLGLMANTPGFFDADYQKIAAEVANQLSIAIYQLRLSEALVRHAAELEQKVTERTAALNDAKARVETILNNTSDGILLAHADLAIQQTNFAFNNLFGCEPDDYLGKSLVTLIENGDATSQTRFQQIIADGQHDRRIEIRAVRKDGIRFEAEVSIGYITGNGLVCTIRDITARKLQERQLRFQTNLQENVNDAVIVIDLDFHIQSWNPAAERIYGWRAEEVINKAMPGMFATEYQAPDSFESSSRQIREQGSWEGEVIQHNKNGRILHILASVTLIRDERGEFFGLAAINHDITRRRLAEESLKEQRDFLDEVIKNAPGPISVSDSTGHIQLANDEAAHLVGLTVAELVGKTNYDLNLSQPEIDLILQTDQQALASGQTILIPEQRLFNRFYQTTKTPLKNRNGVYDRLLAMSSDITERKNVEVALNAKLAEELAFQSALQALQQITIDLTQIVDLNTFYRRAVELGRERLGLERLAMFLYNEQDGMALGMYGTDAQGNTTDEKHIRLSLNPDGIMIRAIKKAERFCFDEETTLYQNEKPVGVGWNAATVLWNGARSIGWLVADNLLTRKAASKPLLDILGLYGLTIGSLLAQKQIQITLRESEERFRFLVEGVREYAIYLLDSHGNIVSWNAGAERLKGYSSDEIIGQNFSRFFPPEAQQAGKPRHLLAMAESQGRVEDEGWRVRKDGSLFWANGVISALRNPDGSLSGFAKITRDMTLRRRAEEDLRQALEKEKEINELKSRFISMASHEFRTPLAIIMAATETLGAYRQRMTDEQIELRLDKIRGQVGHLTDIMEDVLRLARLQAQRAEFKPVKTNLDQLCRSILDEFESRPEVVHQIGYSSDDTEREVIVDIKLIRQIVNNLLSNAIKYSPNDKPIGVSLTYTSDVFILSIHDEGIGIPEADLKHLFEPFHRAENVATIPGTGLGLVITKESVELHRGTIAVDSQIGVGTTFTVRIPYLSEGEIEHFVDSA